MQGSMYVCMCVGYECVSSILYQVMHDYISSIEVPSSRFQEFLEHQEVSF